MIQLCRIKLKIKHANVHMTVWALEQAGWYFGGVFIAKHHAEAMRKVLEKDTPDFRLWLRPEEDFTILHFKKGTPK